MAKKFSAKKRRAKSKSTEKVKTVKKVVYSDTSTLELINDADQYLMSWSKRNEPESEWKFKKSKQVWLFRWMYRPDIVKKSMFSVVLDYMKDLQGKAKERVLNAAQEVVELGEPEEIEPNAEGQIDEKKAVAYRMARRKYKRALQVAKCLS